KERRFRTAMERLLFWSGVSVFLFLLGRRQERLAEAGRRVAATCLARRNDRERNHRHQVGHRCPELRWDALEKVEIDSHQAVTLGKQLEPHQEAKEERTGQQPIG